MSLASMKEILEQQLYYLFFENHQNEWDTEWACENETKRVTGISTDWLPHTGYGKEEIRQHAKTCLLRLPVYMQLDAKQGFYTALWLL